MVFDPFGILPQALPLLETNFHPTFAFKILGGGVERKCWRWTKTDGFDGG